jgi:dihydrolipoyl dehydrogenase
MVVSARLGVETEVFEQKKDLPAVPDAEIAKAVISELSADLPIHLGVKLVARSEEKGVHISWSGTSTGNRKFDRILVAAGRPPELGDLNLAATGVATDRRGTPHFDNSTMQCGESSIFLAGDVDGERAVLHEALFEGAIAGKNAAAFPNVRRHSRTVPVSIVFIDPLLAIIGEPASEGTVVGTSSYAEQGRSTKCRTGPNHS